MGVQRIIAERDSTEGWGRERVSTQHEFWPTVASVGAKLVQRAAVCTSVHGCSSAVPRGERRSKTHLSFAHVEWLGGWEPKAVWSRNDLACWTLYKILGQYPG